MKNDLIEATQQVLVEGYTIKNKKLKKESKPNFLPVSELPDICYGILPSDNSIIVIKKGENGYYQTDLGSPDNVEKVVDDLNEKMGVTPDQRFTMELRSMSGNWSDKKTEYVNDYCFYEVHFDYTEDSGKDSDGYSKFFKSRKCVEDDIEYITNLAIEEGVLDEDDMVDLEYIDYAQKIDKEEYEAATREKVENKELNKKTEAYSYNWQDDIDEVENTEENDELVYAFAENLMETDPDYSNYDDPWEIISNIIAIWKIEKRSRLYDYLIKWYGSEEEMKKHIRSFYETNNAIYFETGVGYSIFDADLLGGNADGRTVEKFSKFVANGGKKEESKKVEAEETTTDLEKAFETEVKYWLQALADDNSNDEIGQKALSVLDDETKIKEIVNELVNGSEDLWEDIHLKIEQLAGIDYRNSSRGKVENKKVTETVDENKVNLYDTVWDTISSYDEEYAKEQGIDKLDDEDVYNIIAEILNNNQVKDIIREEIESYAGYKNS